MYKLGRYNEVIRKSDLATIPQDPENKDFREYTWWIVNGGVLEMYTPPPSTQDELDLIAAKQYAKLQAILSMSPAQIQAWVSAKVTNLAQAQDAITTLAIGLSVLGRDLLKG